MQPAGRAARRLVLSNVAVVGLQLILLDVRELHGRGVRCRPAGAGAGNADAGEARGGGFQLHGRISQQQGPHTAGADGSAAAGEGAGGRQAWLRRRIATTDDASL